MTRFQRQRRRLLITIVVLSLILTGLCGVVYAKYLKSDTVSGQITIRAELGTMILQEHEAVRNLDGSYRLTGTIAYKNSYTLLPGLDVPKDPHILVDKENNIPVYIYVEVVDADLDVGITYAVATGWTALGITGPHGGDVYYYNTAVTDDITEAAPLYILRNNRVYISQELDKSKSNIPLVFYAYMVQTAAGSTPAEAFTYYISNP